MALTPRKGKLVKARVSDALKRKVTLLAMMRQGAEFEAIVVRDALEAYVRLPEVMKQLAAAEERFGGQVGLPAKGK